MSSTRRDFLRQTGCAALGLTVLGTGLEHFSVVNALAQQGKTLASDYKALVCIYLSGGNDGNNMIVPLDDYASYSNVRGASTLAVAQASLLPVSPISGRQFGLHPNLSPEVATPTAAPGLLPLWNQQKLAVMCNTGPLVQPLTRAQYQTGQGRPYQLFSHSDQVNQWFTSISNSPAQTGWGGRTADSTADLNGPNSFPMTTSIAGTSLFTTGRTARPLAIADSRTTLANVLRLEGFATTGTDVSRRASFDQIRQLNEDSALVKASVDITQNAIDTGAALASATSPTFTTPFPLATLGYQLKQVANLIALRDTLGIKRQIFFVSLGGFDTHTNQRGAGTGTQDGLLLQLSQAMRAFYDATVQLGVASQVTTFTLSDFARTLQPAGTGAAVGSDHAWGNHHLIMGGAVRGGDFYGTFPTLALNGPDDTDSRGRWIPTTAVDQYAATLASWYGLATADVPYVFPFLSRFNSPNLGFLA